MAQIIVKFIYGPFMLFLTVPDEVEKLSAVVSNETVYLTWGRPSTPNGDIIQYKITWHSNHGRNCTGYLNSSADTPTNALVSNDKLEELSFVNDRHIPSKILSFADRFDVIILFLCYTHVFL